MFPLLAFTRILDGVDVERGGEPVDRKDDSRSLIIHKDLVKSSERKGSQ